MGIFLNIFTVDLWEKFFCRFFGPWDSPFTRQKNELFLGIFHTTSIINIHMILFGLDKNTLEVYEKKNFLILHNIYIKISASS